MTLSAIIIIISTALAILALIVFRATDNAIEKTLLCGVAALVGIICLALLYRKTKQ